jgi:hypothetical protein
MQYAELDYAELQWRAVGFRDTITPLLTFGSAAFSSACADLTVSATWAHTSMEFLDRFEEDWQPISKPATMAWIAFYVSCLLYAAVNSGKFLLPDYVFLPIHEGGHLLFGWFGHTIGVMGGTLLQLLVPFAIAVYFISQRQIFGTAFSVFFFFENFLNVATYMADARRQELPLVTVGGGDYVEHDWAFMFGKLGLLDYDTSIAAVVRFLGWLGMVGVVVWLGWKSRTSSLR